jgi:putative alpha-1,2-mannosidase
VWSAIGLYPNAGQPYYYIGSLVFSDVSIDLGGGKKFVIEAHGTSAERKYVQRAKLNGKPLDHAWLTHEELSAGGVLQLEMGAQPMRWESGPLPPTVHAAR